MKNYYCIIVLGDNTETKTLIDKITHGVHNHLDLKKVWISTFESDLDIFKIEAIMVKYNKNFFLSKMDSQAFSAGIQDEKLHNSLFKDFIEKMKKENDDIANQIIENQIKSYDFPPIDPVWGEDMTDNIDRAKKFRESMERNMKNNKNLRKKVIEVEVSYTLDELLDKISSVGYDKLSETEKKQLKKFSEN